MTIVKIKAGACGFDVMVKSKKTSTRDVSIVIDSECKEIQAFAQALTSLGLRDILKTPIYENPVYITAGKCRMHPSCPVPCGVIKAAEAELEFSVRKEVSITFQES